MNFDRVREGKEQLQSSDKIHCFSSVRFFTTSISSSMASSLLTGFFLPSGL